MSFRKTSSWWIGLLLCVPLGDENVSAQNNRGGSGGGTITPRQGPGETPLRRVPQNPNIPPTLPPTSPNPNPGPGPICFEQQVVRLSETNRYGIVAIPTGNGELQPLEGCVLPGSPCVRTIWVRVPCH